MQILEREGPKECILLPTPHQIRPHSRVTRGLFFKVFQSSSKGLLILDLLAHSLAFSKPGTKYRDCLCSHYIFSAGHTVGAQQIFPDLSNESSDACGPRQELMLISISAHAGTYYLNQHLVKHLKPSTAPHKLKQNMGNVSQELCKTTSPGMAADCQGDQKGWKTSWRWGHLC